MLSARARDSVVAVQSWRNDDHQLFDFALGSTRVEIKSSSSNSRRHYFSLEQLNPADGLDVIIVSVTVQRVENGLTLDSLWRSIDDALAGNPMLRAKLHRVYVESLGNSAQQAAEMTFDERTAAATLAVYGLGEIPKLTEEPPEGVSEVRMRCDLGSCSPLIEVPQDTSGLFQALFATSDNSLVPILHSLPISD